MDNQTLRQLWRLSVVVSTQSLYYAFKDSWKLLTEIQSMTDWVSFHLYFSSTDSVAVICSLGFCFRELIEVWRSSGTVQAVRLPSFWHDSPPAPANSDQNKTDVFKSGWIYSAWHTNGTDWSTSLAVESPIGFLHRWRSSSVAGLGSHLKAQSMCTSSGSTSWQL